MIVVRGDEPSDARSAIIALAADMPAATPAVFAGPLGMALRSASRAASSPLIPGAAAGKYVVITLCAAVATAASTEAPGAGWVGGLRYGSYSPVMALTASNTAS